MEGSTSVDMFHWGAHQMKPVVFKENETKNFILEFDWDRECITPDWSITAVADKGAVKVKHSLGLKTDSLPFISKREVATPAPPRRLSTISKPKNRVVKSELSKVSLAPKSMKVEPYGKTPFKFVSRSSEVKIDSSDIFDMPPQSVILSDPLQKLLNEKVMGVDLGVTDGKCIFKIEQ